MESFFSTILLIISWCTVFLCSAGITSLTLTLALRKKLLDIPNERSLHDTPIPRGGGLAIVITFTLSLLGLHFVGFIESHLLWCLLGGSLLVAAIGFCDDIYTVSAKLRIILHFLAAIWAVFWMNGFSTLDLGTWTLTLNGFGSLFAVIAIVWFINLYNFMDGIDGLASSEGLFTCVASAMALWLIYHHTLSIPLLFLAAAIGGFAVWNWAPAKIFLGDIGSSYLGYLFGVFSLYTAKQGSLPLVFWFIILGVFLSDATFTLLYRACRGKKWYAAHCEHAYQKLVARGASHHHVNMGITLLNCIILLPLAVSSLYMQKQSGWLFVSSIIVLFFIWLTINILRENE